MTLTEYQQRMFAIALLECAKKAAVARTDGKVIVDYALRIAIAWQPLKPERMMFIWRSAS